MKIVYSKNIPYYAFFNGEQIFFEKINVINKYAIEYAAKTKNGFINHAPYNVVTTTTNDKLQRWIEIECTYGSDNSIEIEYVPVNL